jgi:ABC-2 type transport system ATP-binding protein
MADVQVSDLTKQFKTPEREAGLRAAMGSIFRRKYKTVTAVDHVSFTIAPGEIVGFLGPNGAGKTTTLKMLTGLLHPSTGAATVLGYTPWERRPEFLRQISLLMGQRSQLNWDIPAIDSFQVQLAIYRVDREQGEQTLNELIDLLELRPVLKKPVRTLSLGERMKCEMCASLLYRPRVLFLDEPTIGVDITMQARLRQFIAEYNRRYQATVILTSHYMADVTALCKRIIVIDKGKLLFDGPLSEIVYKLAPFKVIAIDLERDVADYNFAAIGDVLVREPRKVSLRIAKEKAAPVTSRLLSDLPVLDLTIEDPAIEDVIERVFAGHNGQPG